MAAESKSPISIHFVTDSFDDFAANTFTPDNVDSGSMTVPIARNRGMEELTVNSSTGKAPYAVLDHGLEIGTVYDVKYKLRDMSNPGAGTDVTLYNLLIELYNDALTAITAFAGWTLTNPQTGGGKDAVKHRPIFRDAAGVSHTYSIPVCVGPNAPTMETQGDHLLISAQLTVVGAISV